MICVKEDGEEARAIRMVEALASVVMPAFQQPQ